MASAPKVFIVSFDKSGKRVAVVDYVKCEVYEARVVYSREGEIPVISLEPGRIIIHGCPKSVEVVANDPKGARYNVVWLTGYKQWPEVRLTGYTAKQVARVLSAWPFVIYTKLGRRVVEALLPALAGVI
jgi:hypothetical protein